MSSNGGDFKDGNDESDQVGNHIPSVQKSKIHKGLSVTFDESSDSYSATVPADAEVSLCLLIVQAAARITQTDPLELEPLGATVDVTSLENLFESLDTPRANTETPSTFTFEYADCEVTVESPTEVKISP